MSEEMYSFGICKFCGYHRALRDGYCAECEFLGVLMNLFNGKEKDVKRT